MKKKQIPETNGAATPDFVRAVKDNIEVLTGRRKNAINLPETRTLTFSSPPTQAECQALNEYVNAWAEAVRTLVGRSDG